MSRSGPLRAMAFADEWEPSPVQTHTYLFADQIERQPAQPAGYPATWGVYGAYGPKQGQPVPADYEMDPEVLRTTAPGYGIPEALGSLPSVCLTADVAHLFDATTDSTPTASSRVRIGSGRPRRNGSIRRLPTRWPGPDSRSMPGSACMGA